MWVETLERANQQVSRVRELDPGLQLIKCVFVTILVLTWDD